MHTRRYVPRQRCSISNDTNLAQWHRSDPLPRLVSHPRAQKAFLRGPWGTLQTRQCLRPGTAGVTRGGNVPASRSETMPATRGCSMGAASTGALDITGGAPMYPDDMKDHASRRRPLTAGQPTTLGLLRWAMLLHARIDATPTTAPTACGGRTHRRPSCRCHRFFRVRWAQQSQSLAQPYTECRLIASPQGAAPPAPQQQDPCCTRRCPPGRRQCPSAVSSGLRRHAYTQARARGTYILNAITHHWPG